MGLPYKNVSLGVTLTEYIGCLPRYEMWTMFRRNGLGALTLRKSDASVVRTLGKDMGSR